MTAERFTHVLLGGGLASAAALETLLTRGVPGSTIALVASEPVLPYHRPPLSKGYLLGRKTRESVFYKPPAFYEDHGVSVLLGRRATSVDPATRVVAVDDGRTLAFERLLIATGCTPRTLTVPGSTLGNIFTLRTLADADAILTAMKTARTAVVVGGGFIGLEVASTLSHKGVSTTILHRGDRLFDRLGSKEISQYFEDLFHLHGVTLLMNDEVLSFEGEARVATVVTRQGARIPAELVIVGIGVTPNVHCVAGTALDVTDGIRVNELLETSLPGVFAAGDVANFFDPLFEKHRRIEHWDTAIQHGKVAGANMAGAGSAYNTVSYFFSDLFDLSFDYFGDAEGTTEVITRGSFTDRAVTLCYLKEHIARAAFTMGRPKERAALIALIRERTPILDVRALANPALPLPTPATPHSAAA